MGWKDQSIHINLQSLRSECETIVEHPYGEDDDVRSRECHTEDGDAKAAIEESPQSTLSIRSSEEVCCRAEEVCCRADEVVWRTDEVWCRAEEES
jgi:hypothetical protein